MSTRPAGEPVRAPSLSPRELTRWLWRQLTSMRTALILLFLLALAAVPGSLLPQERTNPLAVTGWKAAHPGLGVWLGHLGFFSVFAAPWFAAIYLLLFVSLIGCVVPRVGLHARALRSPPPPAPRNLARMPAHLWFTTDAAAELVLAEARADLRRHRFRVSAAADALAGEKGFWRETGNLVFHLSLIILLVAFAARTLVGYRGQVLVVVGHTFANTVSDYANFIPGSWYDPTHLPPFDFTLEHFTATFVTSGASRGQPDTFAARVTYRSSPSASAHTGVIAVNHPLMVDQTKIFLIANGYAPVFTVRDGTGRVVFSGPAPFLPQDANYTSTGVVKVPDAQPEQLGFQGFFLPTPGGDPVTGPRSVFPAALAPEVFLSAWKGNLGMNTGVPQSVYSMDTARMTRIGIAALAPGQSMTLPDKLGRITFTGYRRWATFEMSADPGRNAALVGALLALAGVMASLFIRRRRVWVRARTDGSGRTLVDVAGLARTEAPGLAEEVAALARRLSQRVGTVPSASDEAADSGEASPHAGLTAHDDPPPHPEEPA